MEYKGYKGIIEYEEGDELLHGRVIGLKNIITFQGKSIKQLQKDFHESVDEYLNYCEEKGKTVEKPFSGVFTVRVESEEHLLIAIAAKKRKMSLNGFVSLSALEKAKQEV